MPVDNSKVIEQLDFVLTYYGQHTLGTAPRLTNHTQFNIMALAAIERIAGVDSPHAQEVKVMGSRFGMGSPETSRVTYEVLQALRSDVDRGYLAALQELIHADVFADYLSMADHLLSEGYKDAAAVLAGGTLENHLRQLCVKHSLRVEEQTSQGMKPKKGATLNSDLYTAKVLTNADQKQVTAWLDIRNNAAHGHYQAYAKEQVVLFVEGLRHFIASHPA
jgi:hypothetical protein